MKTFYFEDMTALYTFVDYCEANAYTVIYLDSALRSIRIGNSDKTLKLVYTLVDGGLDMDMLNEYMKQYEIEEQDTHDPLMGI
jgi:hypothetical protein